MDIREMLKAASSPAPVLVKVEPLESEFYIRRMTVAQLFTYTESIKDKDPLEASARTLAMAIVNEDGTPVFDYNKAEDRELLNALPPNMAMSLALKFRELNRVGEASASAPDAG